MPGLALISSPDRAPEGGTPAARNGRLRLVPPDASGGWTMSEALPAGPQGDLVHRIMAGDPRAEEGLIEHFGEGRLFPLSRWARGPSTAEDLYQETVRLALEKIRRGEVREPDKLPGFL